MKVLDHKDKKMQSELGLKIFNVAMEINWIPDPVIQVFFWTVPNDFDMCRSAVSLSTNVVTMLREISPLDKLLDTANIIITLNTHEDFNIVHGDGCTDYNKPIKHIIFFNTVTLQWQSTKYSE